MTSATQKKVSLDWSRLLGFDQVDSSIRRSTSATVVGTDLPKGSGSIATDSLVQLSSLDAKVGDKPGFKPITAAALDAKVGHKGGLKPMTLARLGAKVGCK